MRDIAFGASGKIERFPKGKICSGKQPYPCQPMFLPKAIIDDQKRHKVFKIVIGDAQAATHIGVANGKIGLDQNSPEQAIILKMNCYIGSRQFTLQAVGGAIGNPDAKATDIQKLLQYGKSNVAWHDRPHLAVESGH